MTLTVLMNLMECVVHALVPFMMMILVYFLFIKKKRNENIYIARKDLYNFSKYVPI